jgi:hypothetical protein
MTRRIIQPELSIPAGEVCAVDVETTPSVRSLWRFDAGPAPVRGIAIDVHVGVVAVGSSQGVVQVLDVTTGELLARFLTNGFVWQLAFSSDHRYLTAVGVDGTLHRWDWAGESIEVDGVRPGNTAQNSRPALSPDGGLVAVQQVDGIAVWDVTTPRLRFRTEPLDAVAGSMVVDERVSRLLMTKKGRSGPPSRVYRIVNGALTMLPRDDVGRSLAAQQPHVRMRMWDLEGNPVPMAERASRYPGEACCFDESDTVVLHRGAMLETLDLIRGSRVGPIVRCPGPIRSLDRQGDLVGMVGRNWFVLNRRNGALRGGRPHPVHAQGKPRPFQIRLDPPRRTAVVIYDDGWVRAYRYSANGSRGRRADAGRNRARG